MVKFADIIFEKAPGVARITINSTDSTKKAVHVSGAAALACIYLVGKGSTT